MKQIVLEELIRDIEIKTKHLDVSEKTEVLDKLIEEIVWMLNLLPDEPQNDE